MLNLTPSPQSRQRANDLVAFFMSLRRPGTVMQREVGDAVREQFDEHFRQERDYLRPWEPLKRRTISEREAGGFGGSHPILQRTGKYRRSLTERGGDHFEQLSSSANGWRLRIGSNDYRMPVLEGGRDEPPPVPPRPVTMLSDTEKAHIGDAIDRIINQMAP